MLGDALRTLEASAPVELLRESAYAYPLVNACHILGLAALYGSILALDLRLLGLFREVPAQPLARALPRVGAWGLAIAIMTGFALFSIQPFDYLANAVFAVKLALIGAAAAHAFVLERSLAWRALLIGGPITRRLRAGAAISLVLWTGAIIAGRWLAF